MEWVTSVRPPQTTGKRQSASGGGKKQKSQKRAPASYEPAPHPGTPLAIGDVYDFRICHEADLEKQIQMDTLEFEQREAVLYGKLNSPERQRTILGHVLDWAISYGHHPCLWAITDDGWYRLMWPAKSYADMYKAMQRKVDLCTRAVSALQYGPPDEAEKSGQVLLQGVTSILHGGENVTATGEGKGGTYSGKAPAQYSVDDVADHVDFVVNQLRAISENSVLPGHTDKAASFAQVLSMWASKIETQQQQQQAEGKKGGAAGSKSSHGGSHAKKEPKEEEEEEEVLEEKEPPPAPRAVEGLQGENLGEVLMVWDFFQVFNGHFELPLFGLRQLRSALAFDFANSDDEQMARSHAFLLTSLHCVLLRAYGRSASSYQELCKQAGGNYELAKLLTWPEVVWTVLMPLARVDNEAAELVRDADKQEYWHLPMRRKTQALCHLIHLVTSTENFHKHVNSTSDSAVSQHRRGLLYLHPPTDTLPTENEEAEGDGGDGQEGRKKEPSEHLRSLSLGWVKSAAERELLRRGSPAAKDALGRRYWEVGASCSEGCLWAEDKEGNVLGYYDREGCKELAQWCDTRRQAERNLRMLSNFLASTSSPAPPFRQPQGAFTTDIRPWDPSFLRSLFVTILQERLQVPFWGQDRQWLAKHGRLHWLLNHDLTPEKGEEGVFREALALLEELLSSGALSRKWQQRDIRERWREKLRACSTAARELFLLQKLTDHQSRDTNVINKHEYLRRAASLGVDPHVFSPGDRLVVIREGIKEVYQKALGLGWPLPPPLREIEHCRVVSTVYRAVDSAKGARPGNTFCWLLLERVSEDDEEPGAPDYSGNPIDSLDCPRLDANGDLLREWEGEDPDIVLERLVVVPLPLGGDIPDCVVPHSCFQECKEKNWQPEERVQAIFSMHNQMLAPWNKGARHGQGNLQAVAYPGTVERVSERDDLWECVEVRFDNNNGTMSVSPWEIEPGPPPDESAGSGARPGAGLPRPGGEEGEGKVQRHLAANLDAITQKFWKLVIDQTCGRKPRVFTFTGAQVDLRNLFAEVCARGGFDEVCKKNQWVNVARSLEADPRVDVPACEHIKSVYETYLFKVESSLVSREMEQHGASTSDGL